MFWPIMLAFASVAALGGFIFERAKKSRAVIPVHVRVNPATGGQHVTSPGLQTDVWSFWNTLTSDQQQAFRSGIWNWISAGHWDDTSQPAADAGITSLSSLADPGRLSFAVNAYQGDNSWGTSHPNATAGTIDAEIYEDVVNNWGTLT